MFTLQAFRTDSLGKKTKPNIGIESGQVIATSAEVTPKFPSGGLVRESVFCPDRMDIPIVGFVLLHSCSTAMDDCFGFGVSGSESELLEACWKLEVPYHILVLPTFLETVNNSSVEGENSFA